MGCYLYFLVDYWHVKQGHSGEREGVVNFLMNDFLRVFSVTLEPTEGDSILDNRLSLYGEFANSESFVESAMFCLEELVLRTAGNTKPSAVEGRNIGPVTLGLTRTHSTRIAIQEFLIEAVPQVYQELEAFYAGLA